MPAFVFLFTRLGTVIDFAHSDSTLQGLSLLDSVRYEDAARKIAAGTFSDGTSFSFAPLYAYYLAFIHALGGGIAAVYATQLVVSAVGVCLLFRIGRALFGAMGAAVGASLWCLYGAAGMLELKIVESTLATTLSLAGVYFLLPARGTERARCLLAGLLLGLACLARPNALLLVPLFALWLATGGVWRVRASLTGGRAVRAAAFVFGAALAIAPATLHNHAASGGWSLISSQGGVTFFQGNNPEANGSYSVIRGFSGDPVTQAAEAELLASAAIGRPMSEAEVDRYWYVRGLEFLAADPIRAVGLWARKLAYWFGSDEVSMEYVLSAERSVHPSLWLMPVPFGVLLGAALLGVRRGWLLGKPALLSCALLGNALSTLVFFFASRYRLECVPMLCLFAADGGQRALRRPNRLRFGLAITGGLLSLYSWSSAYELQEASYYYLLGNEYFKSGARATAVEYYERAVAGRPNDWAVRHNLGEAYGVLGRNAQAVEQLAAALELDPSRDSTRRALGHYRERLAHAH